MDIVFVGAGRLATNLAKALTADGGHTVTAVYSRTMAHADALCRLVGGRATDQIDELPLAADAFILVVKDSAIAELLPRLTEGRQGQAFFHTSGSVPMSVFGNHACHGVIYPLQTFSKERQVDFSHIPVFVEGNCERAVQLAQTLAASVSRRVEQRTSEERHVLHLAAVFASNFANHCYSLAAQVLEEAGMSFDVLLPIIDETARKVHSIHPREAQTGPAIRYDEQVIEGHLGMLRHDAMAHDVYQLMSQSIHSLSKKQTQ